MKFYTAFLDESKPGFHITHVYLGNLSTEYLAGVLIALRKYFSTEGERRHSQFLSLVVTGRDDVGTFGGKNVALFSKECDLFGAFADLKTGLEAAFRPTDFPDYKPHASDYQGQSLKKGEFFRVSHYALLCGEEIISSYEVL